MSLPSAEVAPSDGPAAAGPAPSAEHRPAVTPSSANGGFELTDLTPAPLHSPSENEALPHSRVDDPDSVPSRPRFPPSPPPALSFEMLHEDLDPPPGRSFDLLQEDFEGSVNDFGRSEGLASSMSFLESDGDGADRYEGVRDASESHFSLVPSANLETSPQEAQPGRIASVVACRPCLGKGVCLDPSLGMKGYRTLSTAWCFECRCPWFRRMCRRPPRSFPNRLCLPGT